MKYGDVFQDRTDGETVMLIAPPPEGISGWDVLVLIEMRNNDDRIDEPGQIISRDMTDAEWERVE